MYARDPLQLPQYSEQIAGARITPWAQHAHEALGRRSRGFGERFEPDGGVDVIAQDRLAGLEVPGQELFGRFGEQRLTEGRITVCPRLHGLFEFLRQRHLTFPSFVAFVVRPPRLRRCNVVLLSSLGAAGEQYHQDCVALLGSTTCPIRSRPDARNHIAWKGAGTRGAQRVCRRTEVIKHFTSPPDFFGNNQWVPEALQIDLSEIG